VSDVLQLLLVIAVVTAGGWIALRKLGPQLIRQVLARDLQRYQAVLDRELDDFRARAQARADAQLEVARAEIARSALAHRSRFGRLHEQRVRVLAGVFSRLERLHREICGLTQVIDTGQERPLTYGAAVKTYREFQDYYYERAIWLDRETIALLDPIVDLLVRPLSILAMVKDRNLDDVRRAIQETRRVVDEHVPPARSDLELRFRMLLADGEIDDRERTSAEESARSLPAQLAERRQSSR
jgi:hypothetical protein